jgi:predicted nucleic acid-binding protein
VVLPDTSILVAAFCAWHEHHETALKALTIAVERESLVIAVPVLIETYAVLTRLPSPHRLAPQSAAQMIHSNLQSSELVALQARGCWKMLGDFSKREVSGGLTYDAVVVACATQARARALLTLNRRDFVRIVPEEIVIECPIGETES